MFITKDIIYVGVDDHKVDLFEGQYKVPNGMSYNSYVILDEKIAVMDTVDQHFTHEWLDNLANVFGARRPDYLIVQHMEPDHAANIANFLKVYPDTTVVANAKTFTMMEGFFGADVAEHRLAVVEGDTLCLGAHTLAFCFAPMVHWPEVMVTYDVTDKVLFSADGFGRFGALDTPLPEWDSEARRYFIGIVGKYGKQVQNLLAKAAALDIQIICPLHGPVLSEDLGHYLKLYDIWSSYVVESDGIVIAYTSVYGHTKQAAELLAEQCRGLGCPSVTVFDLARCDMAEAVAAAFRYGKLVLATTTYNSEIYPFMKHYIDALTERGFQNRTVAFIENGTWAPQAAKLMKAMFANSKNLNLLKSVTIRSSVSAENKEQLAELASTLCQEYKALHGETVNKNDMTALYNLGYGLYVVTCNDGKQDNGLIVNTVMQVADNPARIAVCINKANYSHHIIKQSGILNVNCLTEDAPFSLFQSFGFRSGRNVDKFADYEIIRSDNGLPILPQYANAVMSLKVEQYVDMESHGMFICSVTEARVISDAPSMTYAYYHANVKPKPQTEGKSGFVCKICGYIYEGDELPDDYICPLCKHPASDFEPIG